MNASTENYPESLFWAALQICSPALCLPWCTDLLLWLLSSPTTQKSVLAFDLAPGLAPRVQQDPSEVFGGWQWALHCSAGGKGESQALPAASDAGV